MATNDEIQGSKTQLPKARQTLVENILSRLQQGELPWDSGMSSKAPYNLISQKQYRGINFLTLYISAIMRNLNDPRWATFNQITEAGYHVKKGAKGMPIELYKHIDKRTGKDADEDQIRTETQGMNFEERLKFMHDNIQTFVRAYYVFNGVDIEGLEKYTAPVMTAAELANRSERIEMILTDSEAPISYDGNGKNFYNHLTDTIHLTDRSFFTAGIEAFYGTALHEVGHSTGHASRLNRMFGQFGDESYAREELVAELSSILTAAELGLDPSDRTLTNTAAYIQSWSKLIKGNPQTLIDAVFDANKATDYICNPERHRVKNTKENQGEEQTLLPEVRMKTGDLGAIPEVMRAQSRWCAFKAGKSADGKVTKRILDCNYNAPSDREIQYLKWAKSDDPSTWTTYEKAQSFVKKHNLDGVAFSLEGSNLTCIDLDHSIDDAGTVSMFAQSILNAAGETYMEKSVSGHGLHLFYAGSAPAGRLCRNDGIGLEVYDSKRFMCVTGDKLASASSEVKPASLELQMILSSSLAPVQAYAPPAQLLNLSDAELVNKIRLSRRSAEFDTLFAGQNVLGDHSRSDMALCNMLAFFSRGDVNQVERVFRSSGLYREKKGDAYVKRTAQKACATLTRTYDPNYNRAPASKGK